MTSDLIRGANEVSPISDAVSEFYNAHPYPPPVENLDRARDQWKDSNRHLAEFHLFWPNKSYRPDFDVLIAGCGTWQAARFAAIHPEANVVGIDVSTTSLEHTEQLKRKYDLTNLQIVQLPIEHALELNRQFDLIVCTGVLHHLADPGAGLSALRPTMKADAVLYLMVYAAYGRAGIYLIQEYCRKLGIGTTGQEIEELMEVVKSLSPQHPLSTILRAARDAGDNNALADALLNPRDRAYSVSQLLDLIESHALKLGRWYRQAPYLTSCGSITTTPHAKLLAGLSDREQYAAMELFRGTMTTHSIVAYRSDSQSQTLPQFDDERFQTWIPIRCPRTLCVLDRLPKGTAGVLLNQSHSFSDLILFIDAAEKRLFDAIDSSRTVAEILEQSRFEDLPMARGFFEKLYHYDQVVFDASN